MSVLTSIFGVSLNTRAKIVTYAGDDNHDNEEEIHDPIFDIDAVWMNKIIAGLSEAVRRMQLRAEAYIVTPAATAIGAAGTFQHLDGTYADGENAPVGFSHAAGVFTFDEPEIAAGLGTRIVEAKAKISFEADATGDYEFTLLKNGTTVIASSTGRINAAATGVDYHIGIDGSVVMALTDTLEIGVTSAAGTPSVTANKATLSVK